MYALQVQVHIHIQVQVQVAVLTVTCDSTLLVYNSFVRVHRCARIEVKSIVAVLLHTSVCVCVCVYTVNLRVM
jgi:hypothetical protein